MAWQSYLKTNSHVAACGATRRMFGVSARAVAASGGAPRKNRTPCKGRLSSAPRRGDASAMWPMGRPLKLCGVKRTCSKFGVSPYSLEATLPRMGRSSFRLAHGGARNSASKPMPPCRHVQLKSSASLPKRAASGALIGNQNRRVRLLAPGTAVRSDGLKRAASGNLNQSIAERRKMLAPGTAVRADCLNRSWKTCVRVPNVADCLAMVGTAQETLAAHEKKHPPAELDKWSKVCARCCYLQWVRAQKHLPVWLSPKQSFMQGAWGLGCAFCAAGKQSAQVQKLRKEHMRDNERAGRCKQAISRAGAWSEYEQRAFRSAKKLSTSIAQHEAGDMHRLCATVFNSVQGHFDVPSDTRGAAGSRTIGHQTSGSASWSQEEDTETKQKLSDVQPAAHNAFKSKVGSAEDPFRGKVPQCEDWLCVWADYSSVLSNQVLFSCRIFILHSESITGGF